MPEIMEDAKKKMLALECPFTWGITKDLQHFKEYKSDDELSFPLFKFIIDTVYVYKLVREKSELEIVSIKLTKCKEDIALLEAKQHLQISLKVVRHIFDAMKLHVLYNYGKFEGKLKEFESLLEKVTPFDDSDKIDKATLEACRSIGWSKLDLTKSIDFIRKAKSCCTQCDLWHFILGKELRRQRRDDTIQSTPSKEEFDGFQQAYRISGNPYCGVFYAQALKENGNYGKARVIYYSIYERGVKECHVLLRLALGFINYKDFEIAKNCLDRVMDTDQTDDLYWHYRGIWFMKQERFEEALQYLERAINDKNLGVEKHYLLCKVQADQSFDATRYVIGMIDKYKNFSINERQYLQLELAMCYEKSNDVVKAMECMANAIEMDPRSSTLKRFECCVNSARRGMNVYHFLRNNFLPKLDRNDRNVDETANRLESLLG